MEYFTKWVEVKPLATIIEAKTTSFIWKNIICRFNIPHTIVTNNKKQFDNAKFKEFCDNLGIRSILSLLTYLQANRQVQTINKIIKGNLKAKLEKLKRVWADKLPHIL